MHRLRDVAMVLTSNVDKVIDPDEHPVRLCNYVDVYKNNFIQKDMPFKPGSATAAEIKKFRLQVDDVIITKDSETADDIGVPALVKSTADDLVCGYHLSILRADRRRMIGPFLYWHLLSKKSQEDFGNAANGVTRYGLTLGGIKSIPINVPDLATQRQIANFLDRETARIDLLIEKKQRLVALLGEKLASRQQSEIDDLLKAVGQSRLKNFTVSITTGPFGSAIKQDEYIEGGVPILNPAHISDGKIVPDLSVTLSEEKFRDLYYWHLIKGDLLMGRRGELGRCAVVEEDFGDGICGTGCLRLRVPPKHNSSYLQIIISSRRAREWLDLYAVGTTMKNLNEAIVGGLPVPNARREQQDEFVSDIQNARQKNAEVCSSITSSIDRLKEYRSALITAAVTGQIDVTTYAKSGTPDRRLDAIQEEMIS